MFRKISSISWEIWGGALIRAGALITANTVIKMDIQHKDQFMFDVFMTWNIVCMATTIPYLNHITLWRGMFSYLHEVS